jgi:hypothetical protein
MANNTAVIQMVTKESLMVLSEKLGFLKRINRTYDSSFAKDGAKIGDTLNIRVPGHGIVRQGRVMNLQDLNDKTVPLQINNQFGVDLGMTSADYALSIDEIRSRYIEPRMTDLAAAIEGSVMANVIPGIPGIVGDGGALDDFSTVLQATERLNNNLAPISPRTFMTTNSAQRQAADAFKTYFNSQKQVADQYEDGVMGRMGGFDWYSSSLMPTHTRGTANGAYTVNGAGQTGTSLVVAAGTGTLTVGDVITIAGVFDVQSQTKAALGYLKQFTVTAAFAGGAGTIQISPSIVATGEYQNVSAAPANGAAVTVFGTSGQTWGENVAFARDAFVAAFADLPLPPKKDAARANFQGISLRTINDFDTVNDMFITRVDVIFGSAVLRPELAIRVPNNPTL